MKPENYILTETGVQDKYFRLRDPQKTLEEYQKEESLNGLGLLALGSTAMIASGLIFLPYWDIPNQIMGWGIIISGGYVGLSGAIKIDKKISLPDDFTVTFEQDQHNNSSHVLNVFTNTL